MIRRLRWKFVSINMTFVVAVLAVLIAVVLVRTKNSLYTDSITALEQAITLAPDNTGNIGASENGLFGSDKVQLPYMTVQIYTRTNQAEIMGNQVFDTDDEESMLTVINGALQAEDSIGVLNLAGYCVRYMKESNVAGWRIAFVDMTQEKSTMTSLTTTMIFIGLGAVAIFFVISLLLARWAVRPVERSWKQQRQFVSDASHELKTPLAVILSNLEMLERYDGDEEKRRRWMDNVRSASGQMQTLVEELLMLARSDNATQQVIFPTCDFSELVEYEILLFEPIAFEKGKSIESYLERSVSVSGDPALLRRIVDIYLDNACKYAPAGSAIRVLLGCESKRMVLTVHSAGEPLNREQLSRLFERFYRADASRTEAGYGLGLAIAEELARLHRGKVWAESAIDGNRFFLALPLHKQTQVLSAPPEPALLPAQKEQISPENEAEGRSAEPPLDGAQ